MYLKTLNICKVSRIFFLCLFFVTLSILLPSRSETTISRWTSILPFRSNVGSGEFRNNRFAVNRIWYQQFRCDICDRHANRTVSLHRKNSIKKYSLKCVCCNVLFLLFFLYYINLYFKDANNPCEQRRCERTLRQDSSSVRPFFNQPTAPPLIN